MSDSADLASTTTLIENRISRPPNAFMLYGKEYRSKLAKKHPNMSNKEISKILGKEWQAMDPEEKQRYHDMARATKNAHMEQNPGNLSFIAESEFYVNFDIPDICFRLCLQSTRCSTEESRTKAR